jgi:hypothetical protein
MNPCYRVIIVVDRNYGELILSLPIGEPAWIVDTEINKPIIERAWPKRKDGHLYGITSFIDSPNSSPSDLFIDILSTVDLHHGEDSRVPPYDAIRIIGLSLPDSINTILSDYGFLLFLASSNEIEYRRNENQA